MWKHRIFNLAKIIASLCLVFNVTEDAIVATPWQFKIAVGKDLRRRRGKEDII